MNPPELRSTYLHVNEMPWKETSFPGIEMKILYSDDDGRSAILFKMSPGAVVPFHKHQDIEMTYMLEGTLEDDEGVVGPGDFVWRPGGNRHIAKSPGGSTFLSIFNKPNLFYDGTEFFTEGTQHGD